MEYTSSDKFILSDNEGGLISANLNNDDEGIIISEDDPLMIPINMLFGGNKHEFSRPDWDLYGLMLAGTVSLRADCRRRTVGAVIMDEQNRVISTGYNGAPSGEAGCLSGACPRGLMSYEELKANSSYSNCISIHAEENAIIWAHQDLRGCTLYCTDDPCHQCSKTIRNVGIVSVVTPALLGAEKEEKYRGMLKTIRAVVLSFND